MTRTNLPHFINLDQVHDLLNSTTDYEKMVKYMMKRGPFDLGRVERFFTSLNSPQSAYECVHIAGTKGKGSVATYLDALLREHGVRTGRFTSPHLERVNERIVIEGEEISDQALVASFNEMAEPLERFQRSGDALTWFEIMTAAALVAFRSAGVEIAVLETGLGGRLDATNVVMPALTIITNIGHDHHDKLGDELTDIAYEKSGIIKPDTPLITGAYDREALEYVIARAREQDAPIRRLNQDFDALNIQPEASGLSFSFRSKKGPTFKDIPLPALGSFQAQNAALAIEALCQLSQIDLVAGIEESKVKAALANAPMPGRCEQIAGSPTCLVDVAHNPESIEQLAKTLKQRFSGKQMVGVIAIASDKEHEAMMQVLVEVLDQVVFTSFGGKRATDPAVLQSLWSKFGGADSFVEPGAEQALCRAQSLAGDEGLVVVAGSFYLAGMLRPVIMRASKA